MTLFVATTTLLTLAPASIAQAAPTRAQRHTSLRAGEDGSGPAPFPIVMPRAANRGAAKFKWNDIGPAQAWAKAAINHVGKSNDWMRDFAPDADGRVPFKPEVFETRKYFARAVVRAFDRSEPVDPAIVFPDIDPSDQFYRWANVSVKLGLIKPLPDGRFAPDRPITVAAAHRVLITALGLRPIARQLDKLHTRDGYRFRTPTNFGALMLGYRLGLRYSSKDAANDLLPRQAMPRTQVAFSLYKAMTLPSWVVPWIRGQYDKIVLPKMGPNRLRIVQWGVNYVGYPYVWGGEWGLGSPAPAALGGQPIPGFDCSGLSWWAMRANDGAAWNVAPPRPYAGWALPQRTSADMARIGNLKFDELLPGDLMFYDGDSNGTVDHVDVYLGGGLSLDSSNTPGGVTLMPVDEGWYRDHFVHGRRLLPRKK